ncbi:MAG: chromosomal replication initiator DnaA, partial [Cypionkella sp.]
MNGQLAFDLPSRTGYTRADFFPSASNSAALGMVDAWAGWPSGKMLLIGPHGAGKTHLVHVWAHQVGAQVVAAQDLGNLDVHGLAQGGAVAVEDAQNIVQSAEAALFHLHNLLSNTGHLLITART